MPGRHSRLVFDLFVWSVKVKVNIAPRRAIRADSARRGRMRPSRGRSGGDYYLILIRGFDGKPTKRRVCTRSSRVRGIRSEDEATEIVALHDVRESTANLGRIDRHTLTAALRRVE